jgi:hypothetical protein
MSTHTPGPWNCGPFGKGWTIWQEPGQELIAQNVANQNLIAAAPAMLEALQECVRYFDKQFPHMNFGIPEQCRQAIAQAEGKV